MQPNVPRAGRVSIAVLRPGLSDEGPRRDREVQLPVRLVLPREVRAVPTHARGARLQLGGLKLHSPRSAYRKVLHDPLRRGGPLSTMAWMNTVGPWIPWSRFGTRVGRDGSAKLFFKLTHGRRALDLLLRGCRLPGAARNAARGYKV